MKLTLALAFALLAVGVVSMPSAVAGCPDPDNPCSPQPWEPFPDCPYGKPTPTGNAVKWAICQLP